MRRLRPELRPAGSLRLRAALGVFRPPHLARPALGCMDVLLQHLNVDSSCMLVVLSGPCPNLTCVAEPTSPNMIW